MNVFVHIPDKMTTNVALKYLKLWMLQKCCFFYFCIIYLYYFTFDITPSAWLETAFEYRNTPTSFLPLVYIKQSSYKASLSVDITTVNKLKCIPLTVLHSAKDIKHKISFLLQKPESQAADQKQTKVNATAAAAAAAKRWEELKSVFVHFVDAFKAGLCILFISRSSVRDFMDRSVMK